MDYIDETRLFDDIVFHRKELNEASMNRLIKWLTTTECGFITAFRFKLDKIVNTEKTYFGKNGEWVKGHLFTHEENREKNKAMVSKLLVKGYGVVKVKGVYPEGMTQECSEESYLVFDYSNKGGLYDILLTLGEWYNQDSIYFKPKGGVVGYLVGTNGSGNPGYHQKGVESRFMINTASNYMSRLGNSAFSFVSDISIKNNNKKEAMDDISKENEMYGNAKQHYWRDDDKTSFKGRKQQRIANNEDVILNLFMICENETIDTVKTMHPLTRKCLYEYYRKVLVEESVNEAFNKVLNKDGTFEQNV